MNLVRSIAVFILTWEARMALARYKPRVVAITGSVGKTSTKDAIYAALSDERHVRKSEKSFNSEIGVPLTILGLENAWRDPVKWIWNVLYGLWIVVVWHEYPRLLIVEVGADRPGDIRTIARWLRPDIAVITGVSDVPVHVEFFASPEAIVREKRALAEYLRPGGKLVLNGDDERMKELRGAFRGVSFTYGLDPQNDFSATDIEIAYENAQPAGVHFRVHHKGVPGEAQASFPISITGALGAPRVYAALAALAVAEASGADLMAAAQALSLWRPTSGRLRIVKGLRGSLIIDDTYNSSPAAALAALDALKEVKGVKRKIAVLGDMLELGKYSTEAHKAVGVRAAECTDLLITVGFRARASAEAALDAGMPEQNIRQYDMNESARAGKELEIELREGDIVLIKGSQSIRMEKAVKEIMAEPERAEELLVRQDEQWKSR